MIRSRAEGTKISHGFKANFLISKILSFWLIFEKKPKLILSFSILAGNLNLGLSYLIATTKEVNSYLHIIWYYKKNLEKGPKTSTSSSSAAACLVFSMALKARLFEVLWTGCVIWKVVLQSLSLAGYTPNHIGIQNVLS